MTTIKKKQERQIINNYDNENQRFKSTDPNRIKGEHRSNGMTSSSSSTRPIDNDSWNSIW